MYRKVFIRFVVILAISVFFSGFSVTSLYAGASNKNGNPYGNGTFFPDGTYYSATMRSTNGFLGIVQFKSASSSATNSSSNSASFATVYAGGAQYNGVAFGTVNQSTISCVYSLGISNSGGQFSGTTANAYPVQTFTATGYATLPNSNSSNITYMTFVNGSSIQ